MTIAEMIEETLQELETSTAGEAKPLTDQKIETLMASVGPEIRLREKDLEEWDHEIIMESRIKIISPNDCEFENVQVKRYLPPPIPADAR